jgi:beta-1,4-N-acetylglucosaminyltransferase
MNLFITVGYTRFDALFKEVDRISTTTNWLISHQIADGDYLPVNGQYFRYSESIEQHYLDADIIITHAGAGTVFKLLELNKKIIVVENTERIDHHQQELVQYVISNGYALACRNLNELAALLDGVNNFVPNKYKPTSFFKAKEMSQLLGLNNC